MADTTHGLASEQEARDVAEAARESEWVQPSFLQELFLGRFRPEIIHPFPADDPEETARAKPFFDALRSYLERYPSDDVDRTGEIPEPLVQELREMGASASRFRANTADSDSHRRATSARWAWSHRAMVRSPRCSPRTSPSACRSRSSCSAATRRKSNIFRDWPRARSPRSR